MNQHAPVSEQYKQPGRGFGHNCFTSIVAQMIYKRIQPSRIFNHGFFITHNYRIPWTIRQRTGWAGKCGFDLDPKNLLKRTKWSILAVTNPAWRAAAAAMVIWNDGTSKLGGPSSQPTTQFWNQQLSHFFWGHHIWSLLLFFWIHPSIMERVHTISVTNEVFSTESERTVVSLNVLGNFSHCMLYSALPILVSVLVK